MIVFREGLEAVLIFAAVTASFLGANKSQRRPVVAGAVVRLRRRDRHLVRRAGGARRRLPARAKLEAITGFLAIVVLLVVLNWFVHKVYWPSGSAATTGDAGSCSRRPGRARSRPRRARLHHRLPRGLRGRALPPEPGAPERDLTVLEGVGDRARLHRGGRRPHLLAAPQASLPPMLILTGVLVGVVLMVMIGGTALSFMDLGWIPSHPTPFTVPAWMGSWFEIYPTGRRSALSCSPDLVVGSYFLAEHVKVRRRVQRGSSPRSARRPLPRSKRRRRRSSSSRPDCAEMRRSPGNVVLVAVLGLLLIAAGVAVAKKKHRHHGLPRGPYPSLGSCPVFPAGSTPPPPLPRRRTSPPGTRTSRPLRWTRTRPPTSPTSPPTAGTSSTGLRLASRSTGSPMRLSARKQKRSKVSFTAYGDESDHGAYRVPLKALVEGGQARTATATCSRSTGALPSL